MLTLRRALPADQPAIAALFRDTVRTVNSKDYSEKQVEVWSAGADNTEGWLRRIREQYFVLAEREGELAGFASLALDGYLDMFYVSSRFQRMGVGTKLMRAIFRDAAETSINSLYSDVSITANGFFKHMGWTVKELKQVEVRGIFFTNSRMERTLNDPLVEEKRFVDNRNDSA